MKGDRPWYREPETFIAVAALVVSVSAVAVGLYEAQLQRAHDRADVWPHVEISTFVTPKGASLFVENTGLGPAIIKSVVVTVDGKPRRSWDDVLRALGDSARGLSAGQCLRGSGEGCGERPGEHTPRRCVERRSLTRVASLGRDSLVMVAAA